MNIIKRFMRWMFGINNLYVHPTHLFVSEKPYCKFCWCEINENDASDPCKCLRYTQEQLDMFSLEKMVREAGR